MLLPLHFPWPRSGPHFLNSGIATAFLSTTKKMLHVPATVTKVALRWRSNACFYSGFFSHSINSIKQRGVPLSSHCLAALPAEMFAFNSHTRQNPY